MLGVRFLALATLSFGVAFLSLGTQPADAGLVFVVDSTADTPDSNAGDGVCATAPVDPGPGPFLTQAESGGCTLRAAIQEANASAGHDTITFGLSCIDFEEGSGCGAPRVVFTIAPSSPLPAITDPATIEGSTPPQSIVLSGANAGAANGLTLEARFSAIRRLVINGFSGAGILITGGGDSALEGNLIGTDENGTEARPNSVGVRIVDSTFNVIGGENPDQRT